MRYFSEFYGEKKRATGAVVLLLHSENKTRVLALSIVFYLWSRKNRDTLAPLKKAIKNASILACFLFVEPQVGLEPTTCRLQGGCSTS